LEGSKNYVYSLIQDNSVVDLKALPLQCVINLVKTT